MPQDEETGDRVLGATSKRDRLPRLYKAFETDTGSRQQALPVVLALDRYLGQQELVVLKYHRDHRNACIMQLSFL